MAKEYIERERAEAIFRNARRKMKPEMYKTFDEFNTRDLMLLNAEQFIHLLPAADVVEAVRCKDCINWKKDAYGGVCDLYGVRLDKDWFCAGGEKREVQDDD